MLNNLFVAGSLLLLNLKSVEACSLCLTAASDLLLPPIYIWCLIAISWFLVSALISSLFRIKIVGVPNIPGALCLTLGSIVIGGAWLGPLSILPLALPPAVGFIRSFSAETKAKWSLRAGQAVQVTGCAFSIAISVTAYLSFQTYQNRTQLQYIVQWDGNGPSLTKFQELKEREPESLLEYRYIVEKGNRYLVSAAASRIAAIGNPVGDIPRIEAAIERMRKDGKNDFYVESLEESLEELRDRMMRKE